MLKKLKQKLIKALRDPLRDNIRSKEYDRVGKLRRSIRSLERLKWWQFLRKYRLKKYIALYNKNNK